MIFYQRYRQNKTSTGRMQADPLMPDTINFEIDEPQWKDLP